MRIPKINKNAFVDDVHDHKIEEIDVESLERVYYEEEVDPEDVKGFARFIRELKALCRRSPEYKTLVNFLKNNNDMNRSLFFEGIRKTSDKKFSIELHHAPFVMEDIFTTVVIKRIANGESLKHLDIVHEVIWLHYSGLVGLTPLDKTSHALVHSENAPEVFIPLQFIEFGNFHEFYTDYKQYIPDSVKSAYSYHQDLSMKYEQLQDVIPKYMKPSYLYYEGFVRVDAFEELLDMV